MLEESGYLRSGKRYRVDHEDHSLEHCPSSSRRAKSNPSVTNGDESGLIPTTPQRTLGRKENPTIPL